MVDREIARKEEVELKLDYICRQFEQIEIIKRLSDVDIKRDYIEDRAMDILSALLKYLAVHIRRQSSRFGIIGILLASV